MTAPVRLAVVVGVFLAALTGTAACGWPGAAAGLALGVVTAAIPWRGHPLWAWGLLWWRRNEPFALTDPVTVTNDRSGGGVRYQDGVAAVAVQVLGRPHQPTLFTGSASTQTDNTVDIAALLPLLRQSLGLTVDSLSVISAGARRAGTRGYPAVYDTLIGTPPYAGRRETWLIARIAMLDNAETLRWRTSVGTTAIAAGQRIAAALRENGIRARVATASDIAALESRLGCSALCTGTRRWRALRGAGGWLSSYWYPDGLTAEKLAQAWTLRVDGVVQNVTVYPDGTATGTITVRTAQPPQATPSVAFRTLPGQQARAVAGHRCGPAPRLSGIERRRLPDSLVIPVGPSGVLLGKLSGGRRLVLPFDDPADASRVHIAAEDALTKRLIVRLAGAGERITVHTNDRQRWDSVRMPGVAIVDRVRPASDGTVSVVDGTLAPVPRPNTVLTVGEPHPAAEAPRGGADVAITQTGPTTLQVTVGDRAYQVEMELFRAENRYVTTRSASGSGRPLDLHPVT